MSPAVFSIIDDSNRADHAHLSADDICYFIWEYTSGTNWAFSKTNGLVSNLKKSPTLKGTPQWRYKAKAISDCANALADCLNPEWLQSGTIVPVPPSKHKSDPGFDDRMLQVCRGISRGRRIDIRELVIQTESTTSFHLGSRMSVDDLYYKLQIDEHVIEPLPRSILIVDDVITAGTHFKAVQRVLRRRFPEASIAGAFIARRVFANPHAATIEQADAGSSPA